MMSRSVARVDSNSPSSKVATSPSSPSSPRGLLVLVSRLSFLAMVEVMLELIVEARPEVMVTFMVEFMVEFMMGANVKHGVPDL